MTEKFCTVCGSVVETTTTGNTQHSWGSDYIVDKPATCAEAGSKSIHCTKCGAIDRSVVIPATGEHTWSEWTVVKKATYQQEGLQERKCTVCGAVEDAVIPIVPNHPSPSTPSRPSSPGSSSSGTPSAPATTPEPETSPKPETSPEPETTPAPETPPAPQVTPLPTVPEAPAPDEYPWKKNDAGQWFVFEEGEPVQNDWYYSKTSGWWYHTDENGVMQTGLQTVDGKLFFLDKEDGHTLSGWQELGTCVNKKGQTVTNWGWFIKEHNGHFGECTWTTEKGDIQ